MAACADWVAPDCSSAEHLGTGRHVGHARQRETVNDSPQAGASLKAAVAGVSGRLSC